MPEHKIGTQEEFDAAREELLRGVRGMLGERTLAAAGRGALLAVGTPASSPTIAVRTRC